MLRLIATQPLEAAVSVAKLKTIAHKENHLLRSLRKTVCLTFKNSRMVAPEKTVKRPNAVWKHARVTIGMSMVSRSVGPPVAPRRVLFYTLHGCAALLRCPPSAGTQKIYLLFLAGF